MFNNLLTSWKRFDSRTTKLMEEITAKWETYQQNKDDLLGVTKRMFSNGKLHNNQ